ncbi:MAG: DUF2157 domain-containing protein [Kiritimatiellia bacterium]
MRRLTRRISKELKAWVSEGLITAGQEQAIRARYEQGTGTSWGMILFSGLGAVVTGLGVILLFAYNWDGIPKLVKLFLIYGALAAAHATGIRLFAASRKRRVVGEACCLLGTMFFGAAIWLVAQIYHIDEHFPTALMIWSAGALMMAWALPSLAHGILSSLLIVVWCGMEAVAFHAPVHIAPLMILLLLGSLAWRQASRLLMGFVIPSFLICLLMVLVTGAGHEGEIVAMVLLNVSVILVAAAGLVFNHARASRFGSIFSLFGWLVFFVLLYAMTFPEAAEDILDIEFGRVSAVPMVYWSLSAILALSAWAWLIYRCIRQKSTYRIPWEHYLLPATVLVSMCGMLQKPDGWLAALPYNLVLLAVTIGMMMRGCRETNARAAIVGSIVLVVYTFSRYVDLFESLLVRGAVFIVIGIAIFVQGVLYNRVKKTAGDDNAD